MLVSPNIKCVRVKQNNEVTKERSLQSIGEIAFAKYVRQTSPSSCP